MDHGFWAVTVVLLVVGARAIGRDMASRGVGGRHGWRYALLFLIAPWFMAVVWAIERRRFPKLQAADGSGA